MISAQQEAKIEVSEKALPAFCPNPNMPRWSSHPRVYLAFDENDMATCPYCGTQYHLHKSQQ